LEIYSEDAQQGMLEGVCKGHGAVMVPKNEVEDSVGHHDAEHALQDKIKPVLHHEERDQAFKDLIETRSMASRYQPETPLDEARHAIPQQDCKKKHQPRCHIKIFDPRVRAREQHQKQIASPGF
jgi:hypothetical protein